MTVDIFREPRLLSELDAAIERHQAIAYRRARRKVPGEVALFIPALLLLVACAWALGNGHGVTEGKRQAAQQQAAR